MNRSLQLSRMSVVLLVTCLAGVRSAHCQVAALHGPIGRPIQSLSPGAASQLVDQQRQPAAVLAAAASASSTQPAVPTGISAQTPPAEEAVVVLSEAEPVDDRTAEKTSALNAAPVIADADRYLADPRAVAMLSHGVSRDVVVRRIALLSRLQDAAGRHRFSPPVATKSLVAKQLTADKKTPVDTKVASICPYANQQEQIRLAAQIPPEPPVTAIAEVVGGAVAGEPADAPASQSNSAPARVDPIDLPVTESTVQVAEFPPEPAEPRLGYFIAVIDAPEKPKLGYFIAVIDGPEDTVHGVAGDLVIASDPLPIGTGIRPEPAAGETPPEPVGTDLPSRRPSAALANQVSQATVGDEFQREESFDDTEATFVFEPETVEIEAGDAIVATPAGLTLDAFDGAVADEQIGPGQNPTIVVETKSTFSSPFPEEPSPPAIAPAIGRALQQAWDTTFSEAARTYTQPAREALMRSLQQWNDKESPALEPR